MDVRAVSPVDGSKEEIVEERLREGHRGFGGGGVGSVVRRAGLIRAMGSLGGDAGGSLGRDAGGSLGSADAGVAGLESAIVLIILLVGVLGHLATLSGLVALFRSRWCGSNFFFCEPVIGKSGDCLIIIEDSLEALEHRQMFPLLRFRFFVINRGRGAGHSLEPFIKDDMELRGCVSSPQVADHANTF